LQVCRNFKWRATEKNELSASGFRFFRAVADAIVDWVEPPPKSKRTNGA
jgi:hypothetical protein